MAYQWSKDLVIGIEIIDNQHKEIFNRLNTLLDAMDKGKGKKEIDTLLDFLAHYIKEHFSAEEELMTKYNYNGYLKQKTGHTQFIKDFFNLKREFNSQGSTLHLVVRTQQQLGDWLTNHIKVEDKKLTGIFIVHRP